MITLSIILILWGIYSTYKIYKICEKKDKPFNPFDAGLIDYLGFIIGLLVLLTWVVVLTIIYLP